MKGCPPSKWDGDTIDALPTPAARRDRLAYEAIMRRIEREGRVRVLA